MNATGTTQVIADVTGLRRWRESVTGSVGFVPTMGALHDGHLALVSQSLARDDHTVVSIYVNPTQFNNAADLAKYPNTMAGDLTRLRSAGVAVAFTPDYDQVYPDGFAYEIDETVFSRTLCGAHRPGHFKGVLTVVMKLLNLVRPDRAYFGEKDYQQFELVRGMATAFFLPVDIVPCATVREPDGLAMSSRNVNLAPEDRRKAPLLHRLLTSNASDDEVREALAAAGFTVDYVTTRFHRRYAAATLGPADRPVRLIDNVPSPALSAETAHVPDAGNLQQPSTRSRSNA